MFYDSQTDVEKAHIVGGFRFELSKLTVPAIRERMLAGLANVSDDLATRVAEGLGMAVPEPLPRALEQPAEPEVTVSPLLSLTARPGDGSIRTRRIAILVGDGVEGESLRVLQKALLDEGAVPTFVGVRLGSVQDAGGGTLEVGATFENSPAVLFDALVVPDGEATAIGKDARWMEFVQLQYRHCKTLLVLGNGLVLTEAAGIPTALPSGEPDPGLIVADTGSMVDAVTTFIAAVGQHRHPVRDLDPPPV